MAKSIHRRNIKFKNYIAGVDKKKVLGVGIDPSKHFHRVVIFDFTGKILTPPFSIDTFQAGYKELTRKIARCSKKIIAEGVYVAIEMPASYSHSFIQKLKGDFDHVVMVSPTAVADNRRQKSLYGLKTDDIDAGAVGDLLCRGEFHCSSHDDSRLYEMKECVLFREARLNTVITFKNRISFRLDKIYPGYNTKYEQYAALSQTPDKDVLYQGLIHHKMTGQEILCTPDYDLVKLFGYEKKNMGMERIKKLKEKLKLMILPKESIARLHMDLLEIDVKQYDSLKIELKKIENRIVELSRRTPAKYLFGQIKGVKDLYAASYIALIGDIKLYKNAKHIFSKSGLAPTVHQSGMTAKQSVRARKAGDKCLRTILFRMASFAKLHEPSLKLYAERLEKNGLHWKKKRIAVANKLNRIMFALIRDKAEFNRIAENPKLLNGVKSGSLYG